MDRCMPRRFPLVLLAGLVLLVGGCRLKAKAPIDYSRELPPGELALRKISPAEYPDFSPGFANVQELTAAIDHSAKYLEHPSSRQFFPYLDITHERAAATMRVLKQIATDSRTAQEFNAAIRERFDVYKSKGAPDPEGAGYTERVLFTGYCTPIYSASLTRTGQFMWPLYKRPADLSADAAGQTLGRKQPDGSVVPYYTRAQIEGQDALANQNLELVYLKSRYDAYVITVNGSARLQLTDGRVIEVGYAGNNGYDYVSPGKRMIADGVLRRDELSNTKLRAYFDAHPDAMNRYLWLNPRYIFFQQIGGGPFGCLNVPVTALRSIATDKDVYPRAMPAFLRVPLPASGGGTRQFEGFMMDQDRGNAIRAAGRCDIYMGIGPQAEALAGHQLHDGELYYIAVKPQYLTPPTSDAGGPRPPAAP